MNAGVGFPFPGPAHFESPRRGSEARLEPPSRGLPPRRTIANPAFLPWGRPAKLQPVFQACSRLEFSSHFQRQKGGESVSKLLKNNEIWLYGTVGTGVVDGEEGFTSIDVRDALAELDGRDATVRVNSGGGWSHEGVAIHNQLKAHRGKVTVIVEGVAASAASVLAMAGDEIVMRPGAFMMVHEASGLTVGNAADHAKTIEALETVNKSMASIYVAQTRRPNAEIRKEMRAETWMDAGEAVKKRYATSVADSGRAAQPTAFAWNTYAKAPTQIAACATAKQSPGFMAAIAAAEKARNEEDAIAAFIRSHCCGREDHPGLEYFREHHPEAVAKAFGRSPNVVDGPASWKAAVAKVNAWFAVHPAVGK